MSEQWAAGSGQSARTRGKALLMVAAKRDALGNPGLRVASHPAQLVVEHPPPCLVVATLPILAGFAVV